MDAAGAADRLPPPPEARWRVLARRMFGTWHDAAISIVCLLFLAWLVPTLVRWAFIDAVWQAPNAMACGRDGACWAVITARWRLIIFGLYPFEEHWRSGLACLAILVVTILSCVPWFWRPARIAALWLAGFATFYVLMRGGLLGLASVGTERWGGLALTVFTFAAVAILGMPMAIVLALTRQSELPAFRWIAGLLIDTVRALPLLTVLFTAAVILPFALPTWLTGDKLYRVILAFALFFACSQAEVIRGGLQSVTSGQQEAAKALGLGYWHRTWYIVLPQAFRNSLPATINQFVITFKETSIIIIIGFFDVLASGNAAYGTGDWTMAYVEVYTFIGLIFFVFVFGLSRYGAHLERRMRVGHD
jgi:general L-amino acid transport system permease protein